MGKRQRAAAASITTPAATADAAATAADAATAAAAGLTKRTGAPQDDGTLHIIIKLTIPARTDKDKPEWERLAERARDWNRKARN